MQSLEGNVMELKQELRVKDDQLYILNRELAQVNAINEELHHQNFDVHLYLTQEKS